MSNLILKLAAGLLGLAAATHASAQQASPSPLEWAGFYVGAQVGGSSLNGTLLTLDFCEGSGICVTNFSAAQTLVGGSLGYSIQADSFVMGVEGDVNAKFGSASSLLQGFDSYQGDWVSGAEWDASMRARLGFVATEQLLIYATAGVSAGGFSLKNDTCPGCAEWGTGNLHGDVRFGWVVGAGGEVAVTDGLRIRAQYLHADYGTHTAVGSGSGYRYNSTIVTDTVTAGIIIDLD